MAADDPATTSANRAFIRRAMATPMLSREREIDLARRWRASGDQAALHELVGAHGRMVVSIATRYRRYGLALGDLIQEGHLGLMQAAARFDPARQVRFSTYAQWWIRSQVQDYVLRNWSIVRTGTTAAQKTLFFNLRWLRARIEASRPAQDGAAVIARALDVPVAEVVEMARRLDAPDHSLDKPVSADGDGDLADRLADPAPDPERVVSAAHDQRARVRWLNEAVGRLDGRERMIIQRRRLDEGGATLEALGEDLRVSKERVRQIESRALAKLRDSLARRAARADLLGED